MSEGSFYVVGPSELELGPGPASAGQRGCTLEVCVTQSVGTRVLMEGRWKGLDHAGGGRGGGVQCTGCHLQVNRAPGSGGGPTGREFGGDGGRGAEHPVEAKQAGRPRGALLAR
eukprot:2872404-Rhodomonas_salina.1